MMTKSEKHREANDLGVKQERRVKILLLTKNFKVSERHDRVGNWDLEVNDRKVEVKLARMSPEGEWNVNIHRHNKLNESGLYAYIIALDGVPFHSSYVYLVIPAPIEKTTLRISVRSLITRYSKHVDNWDLLR